MKNNLFDGEIVLNNQLKETGSQGLVHLAIFLLMKREGARNGLFNSV